MKVLMRRLFLTAIIIFSAIGTTRAQMLALKSDALPYAAFAPNLGAELVTSNKTTVSLEAMFAYRSFGTNIRALAFSPEFRYYFHGRPMTRRSNNRNYSGFINGTCIRRRNKKKT